MVNAGPRKAFSGACAPAPGATRRIVPPAASCITAFAGPCDRCELFSRLSPLAHAPSAPVRTAITLSIVAVAYLPYEWERTIVTGKSRSRSLRPAAGRALVPRCCAFARTGPVLRSGGRRLKVCPVLFPRGKQPRTLQDGLSRPVCQVGMGLKSIRKLPAPSRHFFLAGAV
jgi:hypothetical protein